MRNGTVLVSVSYRLVPYLTLALSKKALNLSYAWHACGRYVISLEKQPNNKCLCRYCIPCFSVHGHIFLSLCSQTSWFHFRWDYITTMGVQEFFHLPVFLFMLVLFHSVVAQYHCDTGEVSIFGKMLQKHIFKTITGAAFGDVCLRECYRDVRCQSFNYVFTQNKCELSNRTKEARPEDFVPNSERYYFRRDRKRGEH